MPLFPKIPEFQKIATLLGRDKLSSKTGGIGDDGYVFSFKKNLWALSTDASVEGVHYNLNWCRPQEALHKALLTNVSDMNAMGAKSSHIFLSLGARRSWNTSQLGKMKKTIKNLEDKIGFRISGGDFTNSGSRSFFNITVMGPIAKRPLLRKNAAPGHRIFLSGPLGGAAAGYKVFKGQLPIKQGSRHKISQAAFKSRMKHMHLFPSVPYQLGPHLSRLGKKIAAIDVSDGLSSELNHLAVQSNCRFEIEWEALPRPGYLEAMVSLNWLNKLVLHGGEDYQLLFTGNFTHSQFTTLKSKFKIFEIGKVSRGSGVYLKKNGKKPILLSPGGYAH